MSDSELIVAGAIALLSLTAALRFALFSAEQAALMDIAWEIAQQIPDRPSLGQYISVLHPRVGAPTEIEMPRARASVLAGEVLYPRASGCGTTVLMILAIAALAMYRFGWLYAVVLAIVPLPISWAIRAVVPSQRKVMLNAVEASLGRRLREFENKGDVLRAEACEFLNRAVQSLPEKAELRLS